MAAPKSTGNMPSGLKAYWASKGASVKADKPQTASPKMGMGPKPDMGPQLPASNGTPKDFWKNHTCG